MSVTVKQLAEMLNKSEWTIRRWVQEKREIVFAGVKYIPVKDPGGRNWLFRKAKVM